MDDLDYLKMLAGITDKDGKQVDKSSFQSQVANAANKHKIAEEQGIKPGTQEWFKLWFDKPDLQGRPITFRGRVKKRT